jgi:hypothetical protein
MRGASNDGVMFTKVVQLGNACYALLPKALLNETLWRPNNMLAVRLAGAKVILERVETAKIAIVRTGEVERTI